MDDAQRFEIAITAIVYNDEGKYLILRRSPTKKRFPGMWTVPGGKFQVSDFVDTPRETEHYWYNVLEKGLRREVLEEAGLEITDIDYVTSLATVHADGAPSLVISCMAKYVDGEVKLQLEECDDHAWVTTEEAKKYELIDGIFEEFVMIDKRRAGERTEWQRIA